MKEHGALKRDEILRKDYLWVENGCKRNQNKGIDNGEIDLWDWMQVIVNNAWFSSRRIENVWSEWYLRVCAAIREIYWRID